MWDAIFVVERGVLQGPLMLQGRGCFQSLQFRLHLQTCRVVKAQVCRRFMAGFYMKIMIGRDTHCEYKACVRKCMVFLYFLESLVGSIDWAPFAFVLWISFDHSSSFQLFRLLGAQSGITNAL